ncbi:MAG: SDR family oxidoreductase [Planctomycetaceae bacterium]|nr:SDR family oxidoreductase [Planctomycetaceae bacterium]
MPPASPFRPDSRFADLSGCQALVTGASSGIGRAIALELARAGADVIVHCRASIADAQTVADECRQLGRTSLVLTADFSDAAQLGPFVERAFEQFPSLSVWVNNAGVDLLAGAAAKLEYATKLQLLLDIDVTSSLLLSREAGQRMRAAAGGSILNIGWDQADRGMEGDSGELFAAAKNAIMGFTRSLALSLAPEVRVNCIAPGWIRTAWGEKAGDPWQERVLKETPLRRWGTPDDIARLARFLVSPDAAYITGQVINANGGAVR